jgi:hypothetical protein
MKSPLHDALPNKVDNKQNARIRLDCDIELHSWPHIAWVLVSVAVT